jgi:GTPase SAR1 family protein
MSSADGASRLADAASSPEPAEIERRPVKPSVRDFLRIKVLSMGEGSTGKSCLIKRYCEQRVRKRCPLTPSGRTPCMSCQHCPTLGCNPASSHCSSLTQHGLARAGSSYPSILRLSAWTLGCDRSILATSR